MASCDSRLHSENCSALKRTLDCRGSKSLRSVPDSEYYAVVAIYFTILSKLFSMAGPVSYLILRLV